MKKTMILKTTILLLATIPAAALAADSPSKLPKGAVGAMWTSQPVQAVTACVAGALNLQDTGSVLTATDGTRYEIGAPTQRGTAYATQINWFSNPSSELGERVVRCGMIEPTTSPAR